MLDYLSSIPYILIIALIVAKTKWFTPDSIPGKWIMAALFLKLSAGFIFTLLYQYYPPYHDTSDCFKYYSDSWYIRNLLFSNPLDFIRMVTGIDDGSAFIHKQFTDMSSWYRVYDNGIFNDSRTIIRFNAIARCVSFGYFPVHVVLMNFLSFTGMLALYRFTIRYVKGREKMVFCTIFLIPSVLFWGSGASKESLSLGFLGFFLYYLDNIIIKPKPGIRVLFLFLLFLGLMILVKTFILVLLIPCLIAFYWDIFLPKPATHWKYLIVIPGFVGVVLIIGFLFPNYDMVTILNNKQTDFSRYVHSLHPGSQELILLPAKNLTGLVLSAPLAIIKTLVYPLFFKFNSLPSIIAAIENALIIAGLFLPVFRFNKDLPSKNFIYFAVVFVAMNFILIGLTTPIPGAIHRYRVVVLPFMFFAIILMTKISVRPPWISIKQNKT